MCANGLLLMLTTFLFGIRALPAEVLVLPVDPVPAPEVIEPDFANPALPGRGEPQASAPTGIHVVIWGDDDEHRSFLVIPPGRARVRNATVLTLFNDGSPFGRYRVSYQGRVFVTSDGAIDVDCRFSYISGPEAGSWSPDSFRIGPAGRVRIIDDALRSSPGRVEQVVRPGTGVGPDQPYTYRQLRRIIGIRITGIM